LGRGYVVKFFYIFALVAATVAPTSAYGQQANIFRQDGFTSEPPLVWSFWHIKFEDGPDMYLTLMEIKKNDQGQTMFTANLKRLPFNYTETWNPLQWGSYAGAGGTYDKPLCVTPPFPWRVGDKWGCEVNWQGAFANGQRGSGSITLSGEIIGRETVTVKAGTFDAFHIRDTTVERPRMREIVRDCWYAPAVHYFVRCHSAQDKFGNIELLGFNLRGE
jgi:hypothetical protein